MICDDGCAASGGEKYHVLRGVPGAHSSNVDAVQLAGIHEPANLITRIYSPRRWRLGAVAHVSYSLTMIYAAVVLIVTMASGSPWIQLALMALVIPLLAARGITDHSDQRIAAGLEARV